MDQTHYFIVLTGGPGVGKTTLLNELHKQGFSIVEEDASSENNWKPMLMVYPGKIKLAMPNSCWPLRQPAI